MIPALLQRYFDALRRQDWAALRGCLAEGVHRTGPYLDVVEGREAYVAFLAQVIPSLPHYSLEVSRVHLLAEGGGAFVELSETTDVDGVPTRFPEALRFGFDESGRIREVDVYIKQPPGGASRR